MFHQTPSHSLTLLSCKNQPTFHILPLFYTWLRQHSTDCNTLKTLKNEYLRSTQPQLPRWKD